MIVKLKDGDGGSIYVEGYVSSGREARRLVRFIEAFELDTQSGIAENPAFLAAMASETREDRINANIHKQLQRSMEMNAKIKNAVRALAEGQCFDPDFMIRSLQDILRIGHGGENG